VANVAKSIRIAGELGSSGLPSAVAAQKSDGKDGVPVFTILDNKATLKLSQSS